MPLVVDMMGRSVNVPERPQRIISLVPSQTELLADLGLEDEVVGITKFCVHPERWFRSKTRVGGTKTVNIERIAALQPDLIIANKEENVQAHIEALGCIAPVWVSDIEDLDDALRMIVELGVISGKEQRSLEIANQIAASFRSLLASAKTCPERSVAYFIWRKPWMGVGSGTFTHDMLRRSGFRNVLSEFGRYPEVSLEYIGKQKPQLVLLSSEPYPFKEKHITEVQSALPEAKILLVDGEMFSWYGSRLLHAPEYLAGLLQSL